MKIGVGGGADTDHLAELSQRISDYLEVLTVHRKGHYGDEFEYAQERTPKGSN